MKVVCPHCKLSTEPGGMCEMCGRAIEGITEETLRSIENAQRQGPSTDPYPERYWHCAIWKKPHDDSTIENDLTFEELERRVLTPITWHEGRAFVLGGAVIASR